MCTRGIFLVDTQTRELQVKSYRLQVTSYKLQVTSYGLRGIPSSTASPSAAGRRTRSVSATKLQSYKLQVTSYKLQVTSYKLQVTTRKSGGKGAAAVLRTSLLTVEHAKELLPETLRGSPL